jgi:hypothetical protein
MTGRWRITIRPPAQRVFPFDHLLSLQSRGCDCAWVCRSFDAAMALVDRAEFLIAHPELDLPKGDVSAHVRHSLFSQPQGEKR